MGGALTQKTGLLGKANLPPVDPPFRGFSVSSSPAYIRRRGQTIVIHSLGPVCYINNPSVSKQMTSELTHKRERRKDARPGELLEAALQLFVQKGYAATKVEDVAALAGVSKGTLFLYFPTKEDLLKAVVSENLAQHFPAWNQAFESFEGSSAEMLRFALHSWWEKIGSTPASGICKLMLSESRNFPDESVTSTPSDLNKSDCF